MATNWRENAILDGRVRAVNAAHAEVNRLYETLAPIFEGFVGQQIETGDRQLYVRVRKQLPELPSGPNLDVIRAGSRYSLVYTVRTSYPGQNGTTSSYSVGCYIGTFDGAVLASICAHPAYRTDYTVQEILLARAALKAAQAAVSKAESDLAPFGETDR